MFGNVEVRRQSVEDLADGVGLFRFYLCIYWKRREWGEGKKRVSQRQPPEEEFFF